MNKKMSFALPLLTLLALLAIAGPASAAHTPFYFNTYTVGSDGSTVGKSTFGWDETPYLYMHLPNDGLNAATSWWHAPSSSTSFAASAWSSAGERWISLDDLYINSDWDSVKEVGDWTINSNVFYATGLTATDYTSFNVTPEPLAMTLFLLGGAPIAANLYRKHRRVKA